MHIILAIIAVIVILAIFSAISRIYKYAQIREEVLALQERIHELEEALEYLLESQAKESETKKP